MDSSNSSRNCPWRKFTSLAPPSAAFSRKSLPNTRGRVRGSPHSSSATHSRTRRSLRWVDADGRHTVVISSYRKLVCLISVCFVSGDAATIGTVIVCNAHIVRVHITRKEKIFSISVHRAIANVLAVTFPGIEGDGDRRH